MHRIDGPGATVDNLWTAGNPTTGTPRTTFTAEWFNAVQEEIAKTIEVSGIELDKEDNTQLHAAIAAMISSAVGGVVSPTPSGGIMSYAGSTAPAGWLLCAGQVLSQATYTGLYSAIGTQYNTGGEGAGNFRLPDLRGRAVFGLDDMGGTAASRVTTAGSGVNGETLGASGGSELMHQHTHGVTDPGHGHTLPTIGPYGAPAGSSYFVASPQSSSSATGTTVTGIVINNAGSGSGQNMPPAIVMNYIIKT